MKLDFEDPGMVMNMGRWIYDRIWPVDKPPFRGKIWVAYEFLEPLTSRQDPLSVVQAWMRLDIWQPFGVHDLSEMTPHVNVASNLDDLLQANLQGCEYPDKHIESLYLTDYSTTPPKFEVRRGSKPWKKPVIKPPARLAEVQDAMRGRHPDDRTKVQTKAEEVAQRLQWATWQLPP